MQYNVSPMSLIFSHILVGSYFKIQQVFWENQYNANSVFGYSFTLVGKLVWLEGAAILINVMSSGV